MTIFYMAMCSRSSLYNLLIRKKYKNKMFRISFHCLGTQKYIYKISLPSIQCCKEIGRPKGIGKCRARPPVWLKISIHNCPITPVCVFILLCKWATWAGGRLVQVWHWDLVGLQRAEISYSCKNNPIPQEFSFKFRFYSPSKHFCSKTPCC